MVDSDKINKKVYINSICNFPAILSLNLNENFFDDIKDKFEFIKIIINWFIKK